MIQGVPQGPLKRQRKVCWQVDYKHEFDYNAVTRFSFHFRYNLMGSMIKRHTPATEPMPTPQISPVDKDESIKDKKTIEAMKMFDIVKLKQAK